MNITNNYNLLKFYLLLITCCFSQDIYTDFLIESGDTVDVFSYQIPENYNSNIEHPLLVTFHQWGGNENTNYYTEFDEQANSRGWIMLSPYGGSSNNYNHQEAQRMVKQEIKWISENYNIDLNKIYMVGGSMGGASGAIYSNNHLNPTEPMIAATASASGILDCERRAIEMDGNNSMIEWFGGNWDEVPFEYHRNSAIYFADSTQSMHYNLKYLPIYLDFGVTEPHRSHAEELYNILIDYNPSIWIDTEPTGNHGYPVFDENHVCNWLNQFELNDNPIEINVNLDEPSRAYWIEAKNQIQQNDFIRIIANKNNEDQNESIIINQYTNSDSLILHVLDENIEIFDLDLNSNENIEAIGFTGTIINQLLSYNAYINSPTILGCSYYFNFDNNIFWLNSSNCEIGLEPYNINFEFILAEDINFDGIWNILDIVLLVGYIIDEEILNETQQLNADLNNDQIINVLDIVEILNIIL